MQLLLLFIAGNLHVVPDGVREYDHHILARLHSHILGRLHRDVHSCTTAATWGEYVQRVMEYCIVLKDAAKPFETSTCISLAAISSPNSNGPCRLGSVHYDRCITQAGECSL